MEKKTSNFTAGGKPIITKDFETCFETFLQLVLIKRISKSTVKLLLHYLQTQPDVEDFVEEYFWDCAALLNFFDELEQIYDQSQLFTSPKRSK